MGSNAQPYFKIAKSRSQMSLQKINGNNVTG